MIQNHTGAVHLLIFGTDPKTGRGGISQALPGFIRATRQTGMSHTFIPTHSATQNHGKWKPWLKSFVRCFQEQRNARMAEKAPVAFIHMGGGVVSTFRKSFLALFLRMLRVPVLLQLHGPEVEGYLANPLTCFLFKLSIMPASAIVVLTSWWADLLSQSGVRKKIRVLPNVMPEVAEIEASKPTNYTRGVSNTRVLCMSRMVPGKGFGKIVNAIPKLKNPVTFLFAGSGPMLCDLKERVKSHACETDVQFLGWVEDKDKPEIFHQSDIFCLPSKYDSFGMGYIEAMAYGLPIIALNRSAMVDVIGTDGAGLFVDTSSPNDLSDAIDKLVADHTLRQKMSREAKERALKMYSSNAIAPRLKSICFEVL